ncbi:VWA domain-containing protein [Jatrophihabitans endophyticus]|uniref:VWA domain-containing protein n=1 Tax=Jatrophihabitans endophyticus TaxID=1206085 RepID=UPI0026EACB85|nr:VWA domain-containing protein [Jatrophihabitans endophyticus]
MLDRVRTGRTAQRGVGRPRRVPADRGGDLDVDASFDGIVAAAAAGRPAQLDELVARDWGRPELALCLLVDDSGSMTGARLAASAVVAAACALRAPREHVVLAFARDVRPLRRLDETASPGTVVERVLRLRGHGVTGLAGALRGGAEALAAARAARRVVVLLSDCRATDDQDPVPAAQGVDELIILAPAGDGGAAAELAAAANARWATLERVDQAPSLLSDLLA